MCIFDLQIGRDGKVSKLPLLLDREPGVAHSTRVQVSHQCLIINPPPPPPPLPTPLLSALHRRENLLFRMLISIFFYRKIELIIITFNSDSRAYANNQTLLEKIL